MAKTSEEILGWHCRYVRALTVGGDGSRFILHFTEQARVRVGADVKSLIICFIINLYFTFHFTLRNARKVSPHSEPGGRSSPQPPTKAIAYPSFWAFFAGGLWDRGLRALVFGRGRAWDIPWAHGGRSQSLGPFRVRRTKLATTPHQGFIPPVFWPFFRRGVLGTTTFGRSFLGANVPAAYFWHT